MSIYIALVVVFMSLYCHCMHDMTSRFCVVISVVKPCGVELVELGHGASLTSPLGLLSTCFSIDSIIVLFYDHGKVLVAFYWIPLTLSSLVDFSAV